MPSEFTLFYFYWNAHLKRPNQLLYGFFGCHTESHVSRKAGFMPVFRYSSDFSKIQAMTVGSFA
ncbi:Uncharacterized protein dnm_086200 [Desulfonema magnum]|uniref:Uncharacterized protein n=1 Tax=Desulfonema magnum TaxID=45655 RepID=A0A975BW11_9BACT|nr:Uncharacterized protein dnm_086200 [Desulfonema magnum]